MATATINNTIYIGGIELVGKIERSATLQFGSDGIALPAGLAGTLTTRTSATAGVATLGEGHGVEPDDVVAIFWEGGRRYGVVVDSVDGQAVTFGNATPGTGDDLPSQGTALVVTPPVAIDVDFAGDLLRMIAARADQRALLDFQAAGGATIAAVDLAAGEPWSWASGTGTDNPFAGEVVAALKAAGGTAAAATLKFGGLVEAVT